MSPSPSRLSWLDAIRGPAALAVVLHHAGWTYFPGLWALVDSRIDLGTWGVFVFFLVSGYIIPASLERHGDVRAFWIGRGMRLLPLLLVAVALALLLAYAGAYELHQGLATKPLFLAVLGNGTMLQELLGVPAVISVMWTLSYEMAFYLITVALFSTGHAHRSAPVAAALALLAVPAGLVLPGPVIGQWLALLGLPVIAAIAVTVWGSGRARTAAAVAGGALALALVVLGSRIGAWQGLIILAVMFAGTAVHRAERGQIRWRTAAAALVVVTACALFAKDDPGWAPAIVAAGACFAAVFACRRLSYPRWVTHLGVISYSTYLLHPLLLRLLSSAWLYLLVLLPLAYTTHRFVELPGQRLAKRLALRGQRQPLPGQRLV
ncbi:acyltransferase family protein [Nonomuraea sp. NPDC059194]|uniref:acyltransferase family protein n=1 Tax=Nonomuraea sp. NPDC059194 TaxID=3346764 RepID=UPI0036CD0A54